MEGGEVGLILGGRKSKEGVRNLGKQGSFWTGWFFVVGGETQIQTVGGKEKGGWHEFAGAFQEKKKNKGILQGGGGCSHGMGGWACKNSVRDKLRGLPGTWRRGV